MRNVKRETTFICVATKIEKSVDFICAMCYNCHKIADFQVLKKPRYCYDKEYENEDHAVDYGRAYFFDLSYGVRSRYRKDRKSVV